MDITHGVDSTLVGFIKEVTISGMNALAVGIRQCIRASALRSAVYHKGGEADSTLEEVLDCADIFTEYIMTGRKPNA